MAHGSERVIDEIREHAYQISVISILLILLKYDMMLVDLIAF